jgi:hypothetical protein
VDPVIPSSLSPQLPTRVNQLCRTTVAPSTLTQSYEVPVRMGSDTKILASSNKNVKQERPTIGGQITRSLSNLKDTTMKLQWEGSIIPHL